MNKSINLKQRPVGTPTLSDFEFKELDNELKVSDGELLLEAKYISVDPYLRGRMSDAKSYVPPFKVGEPISSGIVAEVLESKNGNFQKGDFVSGLLQWKEKQISTGEGLQKIDKSKAETANAPQALAI